MSPNDRSPTSSFAGVPSQSVELVRIKDASEAPAHPQAPRQFTAFVPLVILLLLLNFSVFRNIVYLNKHLTLIKAQEAPAEEMLKKSAQQTELLRSIRQDVVILSATDPVAAQIAMTYFLPQRAVSPSGSSQPSDAVK